MADHHEMPQHATELRRALCADATDVASGAAPLGSFCGSLQELVGVLAVDGTIVYVNAAVHALTGYTVEEVHGKTPALWKPSEHESHADTFWAGIHERGERHRETIRCVRKNGTMYEAEVTIAPLPHADEAPARLLYVAHDVSSAAKLERIHRRVAALTSHNLKTPLAAMRWQVEMLRDGDMGRVLKEQCAALDDVLGSITRTIAMVEQWFTTTNLDLGRHTPQPEPIVLGDVVQDVLDELQLRIAQEGVSVTVAPNASPCRVVADRDSIRTIVHALIFNAVKYNREGGSVQIETFMLPAQRDYAGKVFPTEHAVLSVQDTGVGIPAEDQHRVFRECFHASNIDAGRTGGAGLGLYTAFALTQELAGALWFTSSPEGSRFTLAVPAQTGDAAELHT